MLYLYYYTISLPLPERGKSKTRKDKDVVVVGGHCFLIVGNAHHTQTHTNGVDDDGGNDDERS